ncbi:probable serine/threonine-protein kinase At1g01540 [Cynara cardunculus var. scolymus]|uniref:probable serine/threonine-protein kinase At1g01540 n=1 Tax=Cynara cardunculus var. scolymus TaxID=59895 RepID=UPI000D62C719|nr:probable serine/threonine-protein kinase At1g01540 [Cynara cardunculus var. scolymus]
MSYHLSTQTSIFGLHLWIVLGVSAGAIFVLLLFLLSLCFTNRSTAHTQPDSIPIEITTPATTSHRLSATEQQALLKHDEDYASIPYPRIHIQMGKGHPHRVLYPKRFGGVTPIGNGHHSPAATAAARAVGPEVSHLGWGHWYTLRELEAATNGFAAENVIGQGGYGIVYYGVLETKTQVAVKNLLNNRGQAEKEFEVEVEAIGRVRHKNLLRLLGYCAEGAHRILVYEYVNNGNLEQWVHGDVGPCSPLTWEIRMKIIIGIAKALTYLHEGLEPKVVHRDIKSSNILLDKSWNPKVSDFGLAKLLGADRSYITTRVMGTLGYVAPEYASTGMVNERSDVYSFGILFMELISGRYPVDYKRPKEEVHLVDWLKKMVNEKCPEKVLDPKMIEKPSSSIVKRVLLVALRCVDSNSEKRPKIGHVVHMLESQDQSLIDERRGVRDYGSPNDGSNEKQMTR